MSSETHTPNVTSNEGGCIRGMQRFATYGIGAISIAILLAGCSGDIAMKNIRTGEVDTCRNYLHGLNLWSQTIACVTNHEAQGWVRAENLDQ
jgi:hypothetical protein